MKKRVYQIAILLYLIVGIGFCLWKHEVMMLGWVLFIGTILTAFIPLGDENDE